MAKPLNGKLLIGAGEIMQYLQCNKDLLRTFISKGMPARKVYGRWYAHVDNIDNFFKVITYKADGELVERVSITDEDLNENGR